MRDPYSMGNINIRRLTLKLEVPTPCNNMTLHVAGQSGETPRLTLV